MTTTKLSPSWVMLDVFFSLILSVILLKAGPPWFEFLDIFDFFAPWYRRRREVSSVKISYKKIQRKRWSNAPPKLLPCIRFLYKVVHKNGRLRKFNRSRENEFNFFYRLDYLYEIWHTCSSCSWLQKIASDFLIFVSGLSYGLSKSKKRGKIITKLWKIITKSLGKN